MAAILLRVCSSLDPFFMQQTESVLPQDLQLQEGNPVKRRPVKETLWSTA